MYDAPDGTSGPGAFDSFLGSRFAEQDATLVEAPFEIQVENGYLVKGRIDAVYIDDGNWEIVDFKSGKPSEDQSRLVQLQAYAVAATDADLGFPKPTTLDVTFAYLGDGLTEQKHHADPTWIDEARAEVGRLTSDIEAESYPATPGKWCGSCDFLRFCEPGKAWLDQ